MDSGLLNTPNFTIRCDIGSIRDQPQIENLLLLVLTQ